MKGGRTCGWPCNYCSIWSELWQRKTCPMISQETSSSIVHVPKSSFESFRPTFGIVLQICGIIYLGNPGSQYLPRLNWRRFDSWPPWLASLEQPVFALGPLLNYCRYIHPRTFCPCTFSLALNCRIEVLNTNVDPAHKTTWVQNIHVYPHSCMSEGGFERESDFLSAKHPFCSPLIFYNSAEWVGKIFVPIRSILYS